MFILYNIKFYYRYHLYISGLIGNNAHNYRINRFL